MSQWAVLETELVHDLKEFTDSWEWSNINRIDSDKHHNRDFSWPRIAFSLLSAWETPAQLPRLNSNVTSSPSKINHFLVYFPQHLETACLKKKKKKSQFFSHFNTSEIRQPYNQYKRNQPAARQRSQWESTIIVIADVLTQLISQKRTENFQSWN